jgi:hypothetical protein
VIAVLSGCASLQTPVPASWHYCYRGFDEDTQFVAGPTAVNCGFLTMNSTDDEVYAVRRCGETHAEANLPFRAGFYDIGGDSEICGAAIRAQDGKWVWIFADNQMIGLANVVVTVSECEHIEFLPRSRLLPRLSDLFEPRTCRESTVLDSRISH